MHGGDSTSAAKLRTMANKRRLMGRQRALQRRLSNALPPLLLLVVFFAVAAAKCGWKNAECKKDGDCCDDFFACEKEKCVLRSDCDKAKSRLPGKDRCKEDKQCCSHDRDWAKCTAKKDDEKDGDCCTVEEHHCKDDDDCCGDLVCNDDGECAESSNLLYIIIGVVVVVVVIIIIVVIIVVVMIMMKKKKAGDGADDDDGDMDGQEPVDPMGGDEMQQQMSNAYGGSQDAVSKRSYSSQPKAASSAGEVSAESEQGLELNTLK